MRFLKVMAVILAFGIIFAGCSMVEVNEERDRETVVATVGDEKVTKGEVLDAVDSQLSMYIMYGYFPEDFATNSDYADDYNDFANSTLDILVDAKVAEIVAREKGCYDFTAEERADIDAEISTDLDVYVGMYATQLQSEDANADKTEEEMKVIALENIDTFFAENDFGITKQDVINETESTKAMETLYNITTNSIDVTEDEVKARYDEEVETSKIAYEDGSASFEQDSSSGVTLYYTPDNVRQAQHILIQLTEEDQQEIADLQEAGDDTVVELKYKEALANIKDAADSAYERATAGEDFKLLIDELGEDTGMDTYDSYIVMNPSASYVPEFAEALFALDSVGDISKPIATNYGYHIIKYYGDMESGPIPYDDVRDGIYDTVLGERKDAYYNEQFILWKDGINIKTYYKRVLE